MLTEFTLNMALVVALCVCSGILAEQFLRWPRLHPWIQGGLFGAIAVVAMQFPVEVRSGLIFDTRTVILSLGAWFCGGPAALLSMGIAALYRAGLGGSGMALGLASILLAGFCGLLARRWVPPSERIPRLRELCLFSGGLHAVLVGLFFLFLPFETVVDVAVYYVGVNVTATLLAGKVLSYQVQMRQLNSSLWEQNQQFQLLAENIRDVVWILNVHTLRFEYISPSNERLTGFTAEEVMDMGMEDILTFESMADVKRWLAEDLEEIMRKERSASGLDSLRVLEVRCKNGGTIWVEVSVEVLPDEYGAPARVIGVSRDVTERLRHEEKLKQSEEQFRGLSVRLEDSLREKEALLKEVHHRVKNNLQVISSLLRMEAGRIEYENTRAVLVDMQRRVRAMSLLHETVYRSEDLARVKMDDYLRRLSGQIKAIISRTDTEIKMVLELDPVELNLEKAIPCGLIACELLSNVYQHAFVAGESGVMTLSLRALESPEGFITLGVTDTGKGLGKDFNEKEMGSLGLQLVEDLAGQLQGTLSIIRTPSLRFEVLFSSD